MVTILTPCTLSPSVFTGRDFGKRQKVTSTSFLTGLRLWVFYRPDVSSVVVSSLLRSLRKDLDRSSILLEGACL